MEGNSYLPTEATFSALHSTSIEQITQLTRKEIGTILPSLVSIILRSGKSDFKRKVEKKVWNVERVNTVKRFFKVDFKLVREDAIKEQQMRKKVGNTEQKKGMLVTFEESSDATRIRMLISELLRLSTLMESGVFRCENSELFECLVYLEELSDLVCTLYNQLPTLITITEIAEVLIRVKYGPLLLCRLVANNPHSFDIVCSSLLAHTQSIEDSHPETQTRVQTLKMLCSMYPAYSRILRAECVNTRKLAWLAIDLSIGDPEDLECTSDIVPFFTGLFLASDNQTKMWLSEYVKVAQKEHKENGLSLLKQQLIKEMEEIVYVLCDSVENRSARELNAKTLHGIAIMRLYCAFKTVTGFKFAAEESQVLLELITCPPAMTEVGVRFIVVSLCTVVACAFLISTQEREDRLVAWLQSLPQQSAKFEKQVGVSYGETLLLTAIHLHNNTVEPVVDLVCENLGFRLKFASLTKIKLIFTQQVFPEQVVAGHALTVAITKKLNEKTKGFLPVHCVHQLMKSRVFTKHSIPVKNWLFKQLCNCITPVHPLVLPLLETFVNCVITSVTVGKSTKLQQPLTLKGFTEESIVDVFKGNTECADVSTTKILLMLYCLLYQDLLLNNMKTLIKNAERPQPYSSSLYALIPLKQQLLKVQSQPACYGALYPPLLRLFTSLYPQLCLAEDLLVEEEVERADDIQKKGCSVQALEKALENVVECPHKALRTLNALSFAPSEQLTPYLQTVVNALPLLLQTEVARKVQLVVAKVWTKLNSVVPRKLWLQTVNALRQQPSYVREDWQKLPEYSDDEVTKDPLIVLRCDERVYRCPSVFSLVLKCLKGYLKASRSLLHTHVLSNPTTAWKQPSIAADVEREELKSALISAQESAALQILLEVCLPSDHEKKSSNYSIKSTLREIQCCVCSFLHQSFISDPNIAKLIHFQGYPSSLLEVTCSGIPSIHICIDFIPELLNQPHLEKQLFAMELSSHLALHFPIPKAYSMCSYVLRRSSDLLVALPSSKRCQLFTSAMDSYARISKAFPPLAAECVQLLLDIAKIARSQLSKLPAQVVIPPTKGDDITDEDYDMGTSDGVKITVTQKIAGDSPANCRKSELFKECSSQQLYDKVTQVFKVITQTSLEDKLALYDAS